MQDNQSGQDGLSLENFLRAVSSNPTDCLNRFSVSEWAAKYRGRREERENEGRNGYPFPLNVLSWPFLPFPQQGALIVICYLYIEISEEERSTHWHLSVKNGFVSPHMTSYFVIIATNRQEIIPFYLFPDIRWFGLQDCLLSWLHFRVLKVSWVVN